MARSRLKLMNRNNVAQVLLAIRTHSSISRAELAQVTGLSLACVCRIADELCAGGVLVETGISQGRRGRPRTLLEIDPTGSPAVGIWIQPETIDITLANPIPQAVARHSVMYRGVRVGRTGSAQGPARG